MLVIDASVAVKFITVEPGTEAAYAIIVGDEPLIAPDWVLIECANAMWNKVKRSLLLELHAEDNLANLPTFFAKLFPSGDLLAEAFRLSFRLRHPLYDCLYLALAIEQRAPLLTADAVFVKAVQRGNIGEHVRLLTWDEEAR